jgi:hypothetical protein
MRKLLAFIALPGLLALSAAAQSTPSPANPVTRTTKAVNYRLRGNDVKVEFHGTELMGNATGEAKVAGKKSSVEIDARFENLDDPTKFGLEYLSLVLWAISPEGRAVNLGELVFDHNSAHVKAITDMQTFGMIVTAEPYFAVNQPGNMVVLENIIPAGSRQENIEARYELLGRGTYSSTNTHIQDAIFGIDRKTPRSMFEARNAVRIAHIAAADKYASTIIARADQQLRGAEEAYTRKRDKGTIDSLAREAVSTAEEARVMAVKQKAEEDAQAKAAADKKAAEEREALARANAEAESRRRADAENARQQAELAKLPKRKPLPSNSSLRLRLTKPTKPPTKPTVCARRLRKKSRIFVPSFWPNSMPFSPRETLPAASSPTCQTCCSRPAALNFCPEPVNAWPKFPASFWPIPDCIWKLKAIPIQSVAMNTTSSFLRNAPKRSAIIWCSRESPMAQSSLVDWAKPLPSRAMTLLKDASKTVAWNWSSVVTPLAQANQPPCAHLTCNNKTCGHQVIA